MAYASIRATDCKPSKAGACAALLPPLPTRLKGVPGVLDLDPGRRPPQSPTPPSPLNPNAHLVEEFLGVLNLAEGIGQDAGVHLQGWGVGWGAERVCMHLYRLCRVS